MNYLLFAVPSYSTFIMIRPGNNNSTVVFSSNLAHNHMKKQLTYVTTSTWLFARIMEISFTVQPNAFFTEVLKFGNRATTPKFILKLHPEYI